MASLTVPLNDLKLPIHYAQVPLKNYIFFFFSLSQSIYSFPPANKLIYSLFIALSKFTHYFMEPKMHLNFVGKVYMHKNLLFGKFLPFLPLVHIQHNIKGRCFARVC